MRKYHGAFIKNEDEISRIREADRLTANILDAIGDIVKPGLKTRQINELAMDMCRDYKVKPAFLGYGGYPYAVCTSVNEAVVHGFPSERELLEGDIVSVDMGVIFDGFVGDSARTFPVGQVSEKARHLMRITEESLYVGIEQARDGHDVHAIGAAIEAYVRANGLHVVKQYVGHGVGKSMHESPAVPNFKTNKKGLILKNGMTIAIEPMVTIGCPDVYLLPDGWTAVTTDHSWSAHFEHSIAITPKGPQILSISDRGLNRHTIAPEG
ncbi:MAG: type I methionyl aminopeptidase [Desulfovibrionaceae bacterium]|nr:type I methionyl aminopeptidase [Desulfovibrionaceae bacterium]